jgi:carbon-monoxide dehydrogenase medium subunit
MKMGLVPVSALIDLKRIPTLAGITTEAAGLRIGATVTHREIEHSPLVTTYLPGLARLERHLANIRVRNTGTLGGNLAFAEPHSDPATFLLTCGASVELTGPQATRHLSIEEFMQGPFMTAREPDEILVAVCVPALRPGEGRGYAKIAFFERPTASVAVRLVVVGGRVSDATVAIGSLSDVPVVVREAAAALVGTDAHDEALDAALSLAREAVRSIDATSDHNGSADYKRHLAGVLLGRATRDALAEALTDG